MPQRHLRIRRLDAIGAELELLEACSDCGGCGGRCVAVFASTDPGNLRVPRHLLPPAAAVGDDLVLRIDPAPLGRTALQVYAPALLGGLAGALVGNQLGNAAGVPIDVSTVVGLLTGTLIALRWRTKQRSAVDGFRFESSPPVIRQDTP
jgi:hypothetical protein